MPAAAAATKTKTARSAKPAAAESAAARAAKTWGSEAPTLDFATKAATILMVTPAIANAWLARNTNNRAPVQKQIDKLVTDLLNDAWMFTGEAIKFGTNGALLDGQHRLLAIAKAGVTAEVLIVTGVEPKAQNVMDSNIVRRLSHALQISRGIGKFQANNLAATIIATRAWSNGERTHDGTRGVTTSLALDWFDQHPELVELSIEANKISTKVPSLTAKQVSTFIWAFDAIDVDDRHAFFEKLASGVGLEDGDPILVLRNTLLREDAKRTNSGKVHPFVRMALTAKAWNAWRDGVTVKTLAWRGGGAKPEAFPEPR